MNLSTGKLYQYLRKNGRIDFLNEADSTDDGDGGGERFLDWLI